MPDNWGGKVEVDVGETLTRRWVKASVFFKDHPEWYAWRDKEAKRVPEQLCTSNPEMLAQLEKEVLTFLKSHPDTKTLSISGNDSDRYCQCEACKKVRATEQSDSALLMIAVNRVARLVAEEYPDVRIVMLAYWTTERPPKTMTQAERNRVFREIAGLHDTHRAERALHECSAWMEKARA